MPKVKTSIIASLVLIPLITTLAKAQFPENTSNDTTGKLPAIGLEGHKGFVIIHSRNIREAKDAYPSGLTLNLNWQNIRKKAWQTCHCYPRAGFGLSYYDFDNQKVLGHGYIVNGYIEPFFRLRKHWHLSLKATTGLGYLNKPYDPQTNQDNQSYSMHFNAFLQFNMGLYHRIAPHWRVFTNLNYKHISNGGIAKPNKGINYPTAGLGMEYLVKNQKLPAREKVNVEYRDSAKNEWEINTFLGTKELNNGDKNRYWNYGIQFFYNRKISQLHALRLGGEGIVNNAIRQKIREDKTEKTTSFNHLRGNLMVGHAFLLGKFRFSEQIGIYLYKPYADEDTLYQRYSLTYQLTDHLHAGLSLKAHRHVADFLDLRLSWRF